VVIRAPRRLMLVGGGHAQIHVLQALARAPLPGVAITLVDPGAYAIYTGMIPGMLAGLYAPEEARIDLGALAAACGAELVQDRVVRIRPDERAVDLARGGSYDVLALDVGAQPSGTASVRGFAHVVPIKPIADAAERIEQFVAAAARDAAAQAIVVGAGAGGVEVAFALRRRLPGQHHRVCIVERGAELLSGAPARLQALVARLCARARIDVRVGAGDVVPIDHGIALGDGTHVAAELVVWATGAEGLPLLERSGLRCDPQGFALVDDMLRCTERPEIFAAGDCSRLESAPWVPRAGVYAVRQGPILAGNVAATLRERGALAPFRPQRRFLKLLSTADRRAVVSYGALALHGRAGWWLKDAIDRRFIARFTVPRA